MSSSSRALVLAPAGLIFVPVVLSVVAWLLPTQTSGITGFLERAPLDWRGSTLVLVWLAAAALLAALGISLAIRQGPIDSLRLVSLDEWHATTCVLGVIGTGWVYWTVTGGSLSGLLGIWQQQDFNRFAEDFDYGVGIATARYGAVIAGGLSIARLVSGRRLRTLDAASLVTLLATVMMSSRLSALMAATIGGAVLVFGPGVRVVKLGRLALALLALAALFVLANYSRNANAYRAVGIDDPIEMAALNAQAYLATPAQVTALVSAGAMDDTILPPGGVARALGPVLPVFLQTRLLPDIEVVKDVSANVETRYQGTVDLTKSYTTNGAVPDTLVAFGWLALVSALLMFGVAGWIAGRFAISGPLGASVAGVVMYGFAETWRIYLFTQGSVVFLVLLGCLAAVVGAVRRPNGSRAPSDGGSR